MIGRLCALFKAQSGKRASKAKRDRLRWPYCLSRVEHCRKNRERQQGIDIGEYSFVNRAIKNWNQLPAKALEAYPCKHKIFNIIRPGVFQCKISPIGILAVRVFIDRDHTTPP